MNPVIRGLVIYLFLMLIFRLMGKRTLSDTTTFDLVLLLIISETTQEALMGEDFSLTASIILICTLMATDLVFTMFKHRFRFFATVTEGAPLVIVDHGKLLKERMDKCHVDEHDILHAARLNNEIGKIDEIKYAVLEIDGSISVIPFEKKG